MADRVKLRHPIAGVEREVPAVAVEGWLALGWERAKSAPASTEKQAFKPAENKEK